MKITITASALKQMSKAFGKIIAHKTTLQVLQSALFRVTDAGVLTASVTNLDETLTLRLPPDSLTDRTEPRSFLFAVGEIKRLAGLLKKEDIVILQSGSGSSVWVNTMADGKTLTREIAGTPVEEFPALAEMPEGKPFDISTFLSAYRTVLRSASPDTSRFVMTSAFWDHKAQRLVATDGRRLQTIPVAGFPVDQDLIIPPVKLLGNGILEGETGTVAVTTKGNSSTLHLTCGSVSYQVRCVEGNYPNYRQVIPSENATWNAELQIHDLDLPAIRAACGQFTADDAGPDIVALFADRERFVVLNTGKVSAGSVRPHLVLTRSTAKLEKPFICCLNARYLLDGLDAGCSRIRFFDMFSPMRFDSAAGSLYVLMPWSEVPAFVVEFVNETFMAGLDPAQYNKETRSMKTTTAPQKPENAPVTVYSKTGAPTSPVTAEKPATGTEAASTAEAPKPALQLVNGGDPVEDLLTSITAAQEQVEQLQLTLKGLKQSARHYRAKAREIAVKEVMITKFQKAVSNAA